MKTKITGQFAHLLSSGNRDYAAVPKVEDIQQTGKQRYFSCGYISSRAKLLIPSREQIMGSTAAGYKTLTLSMHREWSKPSHIFNLLTLHCFLLLVSGCYGHRTYTAHKGPCQFQYRGGGEKCKNKETQRQLCISAFGWHAVVFRSVIASVQNHLLTNHLKHATRALLTGLKFMALHWIHESSH